MRSILKDLGLTGQAVLELNLAIRISLKRIINYLGFTWTWPTSDSGKTMKLRPFSHFSGKFARQNAKIELMHKPLKSLGPKKFCPASVTNRFYKPKHILDSLCSVLRFARTPLPSFLLISIRDSNILQGRGRNR